MTRKRQPSSGSRGRIGAPGTTRERNTETPRASGGRLQAENEELGLRLREAEETIHAIRSGGVDAFVVEEMQGRRVYTLEGADRPYRILVEHMQQGALTLDAGGVIIYSNLRLADLLGVPHEKLIGAALGAFVPRREHAVYDDLLRAGLIGTSQGEVDLLRADGARVPVFLTLNALPADTGAAVGVLVTDLTAQKHRETLDAAHTAVRDSEERYRTLVKQVQDYAIFRTDTEGRATTWNEGVRRVLGFEEDEFVGVDLEPAIFTPEDVQNGVAQAELRTAAREGSASNDRWMRRKDGTRFFAFGVTTALRDETGALLGFSKVMRDQTDRKRLEDELRRVAAALSDMNRRKDEFLATLAHELRNPLAPIRTSLEIMHLAADKSGVIEQALQVADRQLQQMVRLVDDLLDVARITHNRIALQVQRVDVTTLVQNAVESNQPLLQTAGHKLNVSLPPEKLWLDADPARISQILSNLLNNAAKYTNAGGQIWLTVERDDDEAVIRVRDTGIGIPSDMLPAIFEMFTQVAGSLERPSGGLGIGLTLVKELVEMHGGTVAVSSEGLGRGSEFVVRLPAAPNVRESDRAEKGLPHEALPRSRILVVDDNVDAAQSLAMLLQMMGHDVAVAHDGHAALDAARASVPDLVLLDIGLPGMNGYEVARKLRALPKVRDALLVAVTGWGQEQDRQRAYDAGFDHHLTKPTDLTALEKILALPRDRGSASRPLTT